MCPPNMRNTTFVLCFLCSQPICCLPRTRNMTQSCISHVSTPHTLSDQPKHPKHEKNNMKVIFLLFTPPSLPKHQEHVLYFGQCITADLSPTRDKDSTFLCPTCTNRNRPVPISSAQIPSWTLISEQIPSGTKRN